MRIGKEFNILQPKSPITQSFFAAMRGASDEQQRTRLELEKHGSMAKERDTVEFDYNRYGDITKVGASAVECLSGIKRDPLADVDIADAVERCVNLHNPNTESDNNVGPEPFKPDPNYTRPEGSKPVFQV